MVQDIKLVIMVPTISIASNNHRAAVVLARVPLLFSLCRALF